MTAAHSIDETGVQFIPVSDYPVWTRRVGHGLITLLLRHGGPGHTHEYFECFETWLSPDEYTFRYHGQLGSFYSDQPNDKCLWTVEHSRQEIEQVRTALELEQFYLFGNSWCGMLGIEYALRYQAHLKGLSVSNMTASIADHAEHINGLRGWMAPDEVTVMQRHEAEDNLERPEYQELLTKLHNLHICRALPWPEPVQRMFSHQHVRRPGHLFHGAR